MIAAFWVYTLIWLGGLIAIHYFWNVSTIIKVIATIPFIILTPALSDLLQPYENYVKKYKKISDQKNIE